MKKKYTANIVFSSYDDLKNPFYAGGGAYAIHNIAKRLAKENSVIVATGAYSNCKNENIDGVRYVRVGFSLGNAKIDQLIYQLFLYRFFFRVKFDIWFENLTPPFSFSFLPLFAGGKIVGLVHMLSGEDMQRKYKLPFKFIQNLGLKLYSRFVVLSESTKKQIKKANGKANIVIIPNGIELPKSTGRLTKKHVLFLGRIEINQKGLDLLTEAWEKIVKDTQVKLVIAGSGEKSEESELKRLIKERNLEKQISIIGRVSGEKKDRLFKEAYFLISSSRFETYPIVALEAMSYSLPILCFDIQGYSWLPKEAVVKVKKFDTQELSQKILTLLNNKNLRENITTKSRMYASKYSWDGITQKYTKLIDKSISTKSIDTKKITKKIINKKNRCVFVSPHFDDAALSCGGLISFLSKTNKVMIVNIFTQASEPPYTLSAKRFLENSGYKNADELFKAREKEDADAFKGKNMKVINLNYKDVLFRQKKSIDIFTKIISYFIPEFKHVYPVYRYHAISGKISENDRNLIKDLKKDLKEIIDTNDVVFCPFGIGNHADHLIVNKVCKEFTKNLILWADFPYLEYNYSNIKKLAYFLFDQNQDDRVKMIRKYKSQVKGLFPCGIKDVPFEKYFIYEK